MTRSGVRWGWRWRGIPIDKMLFNVTMFLRYLGRRYSFTCVDWLTFTCLIALGNIGIYVIFCPLLTLKNACS